MQLKEAKPVLVYPTIKYEEYCVFFELDDTNSSIYLAYHENFRFKMKWLDFSTEQWEVVDEQSYTCLEDAMDCLTANKILVIDLSDLPANVELEGDKKFRLINGQWHELQVVRSTSDRHHFSLAEIQRYVIDNMAYIQSKFESK